MTAVVMIGLALGAYLWLSLAEHESTRKRRAPMVMEDEEMPASLTGLACLALAGIACLFAAIRLIICFVAGV